MKRKTQKVKEVQIETVDEHALLEQENFQWLADVRDTLSPYWSSRLEYQANKKAV